MTTLLRWRQAAAWGRADCFVMKQVLTILSQVWQQSPPNDPSFATDALPLVLCEQHLSVPGKRFV